MRLPATFASSFEPGLIEISSFGIGFFLIRCQGFQFRVNGFVALDRGAIRTEAIFESRRICMQACIQRFVSKFLQ